MTDSMSRFSSLTFVGEITASVTHELSNVVGTVEQVSGLIEDLAFTEEIQQAGIADRLTDVVERIGRQTERGAGLIRRLNRFAHLADNETAKCDLAELLENLTALAERKVGLRKVELATSGMTESRPIRTNPLMVAQAVFGAIKAALEVADRAEPLSVQLSGTERAAQVTVTVLISADATGEMPGAPDGLPTDAFDGTVESEVKDGRLSLVVTVPNLGTQ